MIITFFNTEIFLYGGQVGNGVYDGASASQKINAGLDEVYILSLPSFVWFKANYTPSDPRMYHTCNIVGNRQMLSIGGLDPSATSYGAATNDTDPFWEGVKVFDLTTLQWTNYYNATAAPYLAPGPVAAHYAAGSRYPSTWSSNDLESLFLKPTSNTSTPMEPLPSAMPQIGTPKTGLPKRRNHTASSIGGAVGGVAALLLVGFALYLLARKRANDRGHEQDDEPDPMEGVPEAGQPYLQSKAELDAEETTKTELEAENRNELGQRERYELGQEERYEIEGDGSRAEMTGSNGESGLMPSLVEKE